MNTNNQTLRLYVRLLFWILVALVISAATAHANTRAATLEAIHQLENPYDLTRPGPCGELGAYQFRAETWQMHTSVPFRRALDRAASDEVAVKHYEWLRSNLERAGRPATPYAIGLAWNGGLEAAIRGNSPRAARDYAQRVANLTAFLDRAEKPVVVEPKAPAKSLFTFADPAESSPVQASPIQPSPLLAARTVPPVDMINDHERMERSQAGWIALSLHAAR